MPIQLLFVAFMIAPAPEVTRTPTPSGIPGYICMPGYTYDPKSGQYKPNPTPTRLPRPSVEIIKPCRNPPDWAEGAVNYRDCDVEVVIGSVKDVDVEAHFSGSDSISTPMVLLEVEDAFPASVGPSILFSQAIHGQGPHSDEPIRKGDRVLVTLLRRPRDYSWDCGRLRPCDTAPEVNWVGVELFRPADWP